jgi:hypothetical protein
LIDKYCGIYNTLNGNEAADMYGYADVNYISPALVPDVIANGNFKGTTGWIGTYSIGSSENSKEQSGA